MRVDLLNLFKMMCRSIEFFKKRKKMSDQGRSLEVNTEVKQSPSNTTASIPSNFIKGTDLLTSEQQELDKHEEKIQTGFEKFSAY